jgi:hypothetical protein
VIATRAEFFRDVLPVGSEVAELGVFLGMFSDVILRLNRPARLWLVDLWAEGTYTCCDTNNEHTIVVSKTENLPAWLAHKYQHWPEVSLCQESSLDFLACCPALDCVYIDTTHTYEQTIAELRASLRVVRHGGWIGGHDLSLPGVAAAFREFTALESERIMHTVVTSGEILPSFFLRVK